VVHYQDKSSALWNHEVWQMRTKALEVQLLTSSLLPWRRKE